MSLSSKRPLIVGITGSIGSGKSIVSHIFETLGIPVYYSDVEAKKLYDNTDFQKKLLALFGRKVFDKDGIPDKKLIAELVFNDKSALQQLNALIHPAVKIHFLEWVEKQKRCGNTYVIQESALLFESGFDSLFDKIITVYAEEKTLIERIQKRDNISEEQILARIRNQMPAEEKKNRADFVIINDEVQLIMPQILSIHEQLTHLSK